MKNPQNITVIYTMHTGQHSYGKLITPCGLLYFRSNEIQTTKYEIETPSFRCPKLWTSLLDDCETLTSLEEYRAKIKTCVPEN